MIARLKEAVIRFWEDWRIDVAGSSVLATSGTDKGCYNRYLRLCHKIQNDRAERARKRTLK
jgi:hypothetical protein